MLPVYLQAISSITLKPVCSATEVNSGWMDNIVKYLQMGKLPDDEKNAYKVRVQATRFTLSNDRLYKRSFGGPYLRFLNDLETKYLLVEFHEGVCGNHSSGRTLAHRAHT